MYRDIGGSDPERMAAPRVAEYVKECLEGSGVKVDVISDLATLQKNYPLLAAVNRCANGELLFCVLTVSSGMKPMSSLFGPIGFWCLMRTCTCLSFSVLPAPYELVYNVWVLSHAEGLKHQYPQS